MTYGPEANANLLKNYTGQCTIHIHIYTYSLQLARKQNARKMPAD